MTPQQIVGLAARLFSIWLAILTLQLIGKQKALENKLGLETFDFYYLAAAIVFLLAVVLWFFPMSIAHRLIPRTKHENVFHIPASEAVSTASIIFGLWLFVSKVLPSLAYYIPLIIVIRSQDIPLSSAEEFGFMRLAPAAIEMSVVFVLCFKARAIAKYLITEHGKR